MAKPNPFVVSLNQPPKGVHRGQHRRTSPTTHRDPSDGASAGAGGTVVRTSIPTSAWRAGSFLPINPSTFTRGGGNSITQLVQDQMVALSNAMIMGVDLARPDSSPPPLPYAGIRSGEIIGHRLWWVLSDGLYSLAHRFRWEPGATVEGDLEKVVWKGIFSNSIYGGVYAYASLDDRIVEECILNQDLLLLDMCRRSRYLSNDNPGLYAIGLVRGTVKLWGEVIEHETGWRAQFAKLASIEEVWAEGGDGVFRIQEVLEPYRASLAI